MAVSITGDGQILGAWSTHGQMATPLGLARDVLQVVEYRPTDGWSAPRTLGTTGGSVAPPSLDMNDRGEAIVGWPQFRVIPVIPTEHGDLYGHSVVISAIRLRTGAWSPPRRLSAPRPEFSAYTIDVGIAGGGEIFATWPMAESLGKSLGMKAATGSASSGWRKRFTISRRGNGLIGFEPQLAVADGPHAIIGWNQLAGPRGRRTPVVGVSVNRERGMHK